MDERSLWRMRWLEAIREVSDVGVQRHSWLNETNDNPHFTFVELNSCYFDDLSLGGGYATAVANDLVSEDEVTVVAAFHALFDHYSAPQDDDFDHAAILGDAKWLAVVQEAERARLRLLSLVATNERSFLTELTPESLLASRPKGTA